MFNPMMMPIPMMMCCCAACCVFLNLNEKSICKNAGTMASTCNNVADYSVPSAIFSLCAAAMFFAMTSMGGMGMGMGGGMGGYGGMY